jgi:hypothetical protein
MGSEKKDDELMIHVLNNLTIDYELHMYLWEKRIVNKENPLEVDELREELNHRFERLSIQSEFSNKIRENEEQDLIKVQFNGKCRNCRVLGHMSVNCKPRRNQGNRENDTNPQPLYCVYCRKVVNLKPIDQS